MERNYYMKKPKLFKKKYAWHEMEVHHTAPPHYCELVYKKAQKHAQWLSKRDAVALVPDIEDRIEHGQVSFAIELPNQNNHQVSTEGLIDQSTITLKDIQAITNRLSEVPLKEHVIINLERGGQIEMKIAA